MTHPWTRSEPTAPDDSHLRAVEAATAAAVAGAEPIGSAHDGAPTAVTDAIAAAVAELADELVAVPRSARQGTPPPRFSPRSTPTCWCCWRSYAATTPARGWAR